MNEGGFGKLSGFLVGALALICSPAFAGYVATQTVAPAPAYGTTLNFDEVGGPVPGTYPGNYHTNWNASHGVDVRINFPGQFLFLGDVGAEAHPLPTNPGDIGTANAIYGDGGLSLHFVNPTTELSFRGWGEAPGNGPNATFLILYSGGSEVFNSSSFANGMPRMEWPGNGNSQGEWYNVVATGGDTFDEVRFFTQSFSLNDTAMDDLSWNSVPEPTSLMLLSSVFGIAMLRRRR